MALYDMARRNFVPIELFEVVFKESISQKPLFLSNEKVSSLFVLISHEYYVRKDFRCALDSSNEALTWYMYKGIALKHLGRNDEAVEWFNKALDIDLTLARAWMYKGYSLVSLGRHKEALVCCDKALELDPNDITPYALRGMCFDMMGKHEQAIECYDNMLSYRNKYKNPSFLKLLEQLPIEAIDLRDEYVLNMNLNESYIHSLKGNSLLMVGKSDEAISCFDKALEINPYETNALYNKGNILFKLGKYEQAQYCLDKAKKLRFNINSQEEKID